MPCAGPFKRLVMLVPATALPVQTVPVQCPVRGGAAVSYDARARHRTARRFGRGSGATCLYIYSYIKRYALGLRAIYLSFLRFNPGPSFGRLAPFTNRRARVRLAATWSVAALVLFS